MTTERRLVRPRCLLAMALLIGLLPPPGTRAQVAEEPPPLDRAETPPGLISLSGEDETRAEELAQAVQAAIDSGRWEDAIARQEELVDLRRRVQGPAHFETANEEWVLETCRRVSAMQEDDRAAYSTL